MNSYIVNFTVYTLAMIGFIAIAVIVYKKSMQLDNKNYSKDFLKAENFLRLTPTKTLYVIKAGTERFLIAADSATTTLISKLDASNTNMEHPIKTDV